MWKLAGLFLVVGLQIPAGAQTPAERIVAERRARCVENYATAERTLITRVMELESRKSSGYLVMGGSAGGLLYCIYRTRSVPGIIGCSTLFALPAGAGVAWNDQLQKEIQKSQEAATIMRIYAAIKDSRDEADEVIGLMRDLRIDVKHEQFAKGNVIRAMENGSLCDEHGVPNARYEDFLSLVRPGDL